MDPAQQDCVSVQTSGKTPFKSGELFGLTETAWVGYRLAAENRTSQLPWRLAQYRRQVCAVQTTAVDHPQSPCMVRG